MSFGFGSFGQNNQSSGFGAGSGFGGTSSAGGGAGGSGRSSLFFFSLHFPSLRLSPVCLLHSLRIPLARGDMLSVQVDEPARSTHT